MRTHHLSRSQRFALTVVLSAAILVPLLLLLPRYLDWQAQQKAAEFTQQAPAAAENL